MPDLDQTVTDFTATMTPQAPTIAGASVQRDVPIRKPEVGADVGVPFLQSFVSGVLTFGGVGLIALALHLPVAVPGAAAGAVIVVVWFWRLVGWQSLLWATETITGADLDNDGAVGEPEKGEWSINLIDERDNRKRLHFTGRNEAQHAIEAARKVVKGTPFSESALTGTGRPLSRTEFHRFREQLFERGYAFWKDPEHHTLGIGFTVTGARALRSVAEWRTTDARTRTQRGTQALPPGESGGGGYDD